MKPKTLFFIGMFLLLLILLGWQNTPYSSEKEPLLLLPQLRKVQNYQRQVLKWMVSLQDCDGRLAVLFSSEKRDLYQVSREAEMINRNLASLYQEIDRKSPPESLQGLQDVLLETATAYLAAANLGLDWISSGADGDLDTARIGLAEAHAFLQQLQSLPWTGNR